MIPNSNHRSVTLPLNELQALEANAIHLLELQQEKAIEEALIAKIAFDLQEKGISIQQNAIPEALVSQLRTQFEQGEMTEGFLTSAGIGRKQQFQQNRQIRQDSIRWIEGSSEVEIRWLDLMERLRITLNRQLFLGLSSFESHYAKYKAGELYHRHFDAFSGKSNRKFSFILYLNQNWQKSDGGELVVETENNHILKVLPEAGTIVCFLSEEFPHQVLPPFKDRLSIAGWFSVGSKSVY